MKHYKEKHGKVKTTRSFIETFYMVVSDVSYLRVEGVLEDYPKLKKAELFGGTLEVMELCLEIAQAFEKENEGRTWDGEFFEKIEDFTSEYIGQTINEEK